VDLAPLLVALPASLLLLLGIVPNRLANRVPRSLGRVVSGLTATALACFVIASATLALRGGEPLSAVYASAKVSGASTQGELAPITLGVYFDQLAAVMALLITFVGWVIARYSVRYLGGDPKQGRFLRWIGFTLGAVLLLVVSRNLVMFTAAWMLTSAGLHNLLTHRRERPGALLAARKKFVISRLGDAMLVVALVLTYRLLGSFEYADVFEAARSLRESGEGGASVTLIGLLYVVGAMTKSAQFPLHTWLPETMETPTPVSALMHAGIINAGGFLVLRLSPLVSLSPLALEVLALVGAVTAILGAVVMLTQTSVKRALAYSTVAQMGFMMLQCGLGAFAAALLHIVAHSLYKAHAFLRSGSVIDDAEASRPPRPVEDRGAMAAALTALPVGAAIAAGGIGLVGAIDGPKPGALVLGLVLSIALAQLIAAAIRTGRSGLVAKSVGAAVGVTAAYLLAYLASDRLLGDSIAHEASDTGVIGVVVLSVVAVGFVGVFLLQQSLSAPGYHPAWLRRFYVHARNGFYIDLVAHKLVAKLGPTPHG
jgi:NAD(P)H-quinone oxidoreductase subunit 5